MATRPLSHQSKSDGGAPEEGRSQAERIRRLKAWLKEDAARPNPELEELWRALQTDEVLRPAFDDLVGELRENPDRDPGPELAGLADLTIARLPRLARLVKDKFLASWTQSLVLQEAWGAPRVTAYHRKLELAERHRLVEHIDEFDAFSSGAPPGRPAKELRDRAYALRDAYREQGSDYTQQQFAESLGLDLADWRAFRRATLGVNWGEFKAG